MKTSKLASILFMTMTFAILVSGCGGAGKTSASLEVVNGFLVSANGYDGGLIVHGKSDAGDTFSFALTNTLTSTVELPNGNWTFRAIGWYGYSDSTYKFGGAPYCASTTVSLTGGSASVNLAMATAKCDSDAFASAQFRNGGTLKDMNSVLALKTLLKYPVNISDIVSTKIFSSSSSDTTILSSIPDDLKSTAKAIRFFALKKDLKGNWTEGFSSKCMGGGSSGQFLKVANQYTSTDFKLPTLLPMGVAIYKDTSCAKELSRYNFPEGFEKPAEDGDHLMQLDPSTNNRLIIIASDHRRGYSPFMALLPTIQCGATGSPVRCKTISGSLPDFVLFLGNPSEQVFIPDASNCGVVTFSANLTGSCTVTTDGLKIQVNTTNGALTNASSESITVGGTSYSIAFQDGTAGDREKKWGFNDLLSYIGPDTFSNYKRSFIESNNGGDDDPSREAWGLLGRVREHLSPAGASGLFGISNPSLSFRANCAAVSGSKDITLKDDDGTSETYRVTASPATLSPDTYTCNTATPDAASCSITYEKKIQVFNVKNSTSIPEMTFTLDCDNIIGKFSAKDEKVEDTSTRKHKDQMIISWNTETASNHANQRYEFVRMEEGWEYNGASWVKVDDRREIGRVFKTEQDRAQVVAFTYNTHTDVALTSRNSNLEARQTSLDHINSAACISNLSQASSDLSATDLFTATFSTFRSTAYTLYNTFSPSQLGISATYQTSTYGPASTTCSSLPANKLTGLTTSSNSNHLINKTLSQNVDSLTNLDTTVFSSNAYLNH